MGRRRRGGKEGCKAYLWCSGTLNINTPNNAFWMLSLLRHGCQSKGDIRATVYAFNSYHPEFFVVTPVLLPRCVEPGKGAHGAGGIHLEYPSQRGRERPGGLLGDPQARKGKTRRQGEGHEDSRRPLHCDAEGETLVIETRCGTVVTFDCSEEIRQVSSLAGPV